MRAAAAAPILCALVLELLPPTIWVEYELYDKIEEYGEARNWGSNVRTRFNSWTSFALYFAGLYAFADAESESSSVNAWRRAYGILLMWAGISSFLFHASLTEKWRTLDAGATMSAMAVPLGYVGYRALQRIGRAPPHSVAFCAILCLVVGFHVLAQQPGWSTSVLALSIAGMIFVDYVLLGRAEKSTQEWKACGAFVAACILGVLLRAMDVKCHHSDPFGVVWMGHTLWHFLISTATLIAYDGMFLRFTVHVGPQKLPCDESMPMRPQEV